MRRLEKLETAQRNNQVKVIGREKMQWVIEIMYIQVVVQLLRAGNGDHVW